MKNTLIVLIILCLSFSGMAAHPQKHLQSQHGINRGQYRLKRCLQREVTRPTIAKTLTFENLEEMANNLSFSCAKKNGLEKVEDETIESARKLLQEILDEKMKENLETEFEETNFEI